VAVADSLDALASLVAQQTRPGDLVLAMGAGDVNSLWERLSRRSEPVEPIASALAA
jgi:UDP-N-acetylmuramate--alanine ligase